jgi:hypothetical protein
MIRLHLKHDYKKLMSHLKGRYASERHFDGPITQPAEVLKPNGDTLGILVKGKIDSSLQAKTFELLKTVYGLPSMRPGAVGAGSSQRRIKRDRTLSNMRAVPYAVLEVLKRNGVQTSQFGYMDPLVNRFDCRETAWSVTEPALLEGLLPFLLEADEAFRDNLPERYAAQLAECRKAPDWNLHGTCFTTGTVNLNWRVSYHRDSHDLKNGFGVMAALGSSLTLVYPRFRCAFEMQPGDILLGDVHELHAQLPFTRDQLAIVLYCREHIAACQARPR